MDSALLNFFNDWFERTVGGPLYSYQESLIPRFLLKNEPIVVNKARQIGFTTLLSACIVYDAVFEGRKNCVYSNSKDNAAHVLEYANEFLTTLKEIFPLALPEMTTDRKTLLRFKNGGDIRSFAVSPETVRGYPADRVYCDEFAHLTGELHIDKKLLQAVRPQVAKTGGTIRVMSTPGVVGNRYWEMWRDSPERNKITVHWTECPTLKIREEILPFGKQYWIGNSPDPMPEMEFRMEFCNEFDPGFGAAIPQDAIMAAENPDAKTVEML